MAREIFLISMAARELGMHPQTLRKYARLGLVRPLRTVGSMRVYTNEEIKRLKVIKYLVDELGINLSGVQQLLMISEVVDRLKPLLEEIDFQRPSHRRALRKEMVRLNRLLGH